MQRDFIYKGGASKRFHTCQTLKEQDIAAHSFGVAWFCELLTNGKASKDLIMAALAHDLAEHRVGDIPSPVKRAMNVLDKFHEYERLQLDKAGLGHYESRLSPSEKLTLTLADQFDGLMYCLQETRLGNGNLAVVFGNFQQYICDIFGNEDNPIDSDVEKKAREFYIDINQEWKEF